MHLIINMIKEKKSNCCGCQACMNICPVQAISMKEDIEGFLYPFIDEKNCIRCGACDETCPMLQKQSNEEGIPEAYAYMNLNDDIRMKSSSGGIFTELADHVLGQDGYVFGAAFNERWDVHHIGIHELNQLDSLRGSKYVQSNIEKTYQQVKVLLQKDKMVLFTGTPCQIEGLNAYLGKCSRGNLILVDCICHGVPSPSVWREYVKCRKGGNEIQQISFRNKNLSWERYLLLFMYMNNNKYLAPLDKDLYLQGFLQDFYLRPSCYSCPFKKIHRVSDITMADFWGVDQVISGWNDHKGTSLVILHSKKGKQIFREISGKKVEVPLEQAIIFNPAMVKAAIEPVKRKIFFKEYISGKFDLLSLLKVYTKRPLKERVKQKLFLIVRCVLPKAVRKSIRKIYS